jgi:hypothetical protein
MKTPTNFIPIIGPLYADDLQINNEICLNNKFYNMNNELEESYIGTVKAYFESLFNKNADEYLNEFLMYLNEKTNRRLLDEIEELYKSINELIESRILVKLND